MTKSNYVFGIHAISALLQQQPGRILRLCFAKERQDKKITPLLELAQQQGIATEACTRQTLDRLALNEQHQGILAVCKQAASLTEHDLAQLLQDSSQAPLLLILDGVQDPHNLGACLRTADASGVSALIAPKDKAVGITPTVSKVASGAAETVPFIQVTNLARTIEKLKSMNIWVYGADMAASQSIYQTDFRGPSAIVLGAEGTGLRRLTRDLCDALIHIPMQGTVESLNVSVSAGIILFEALRQRSQK
jgi:23S rRNA (guanosine2251-2'-O)-methyltransferase